MVFSSLQFIFCFLPAAFLGGIVTRRWIRFQNVFLLFASILFYSLGEPKYVYLFIVSIATNWILTFLASKAEKRWLKRAIGMVTILLDLLILFWYKYAGWIGGIFGLDFGSNHLPIGVSFYTFQAISYVADVTLMDKYEAEKNPINVGLYIAFFPQLIAGPIIRYQDMRAQIRQRSMSWEDVEYGSFRFLLGLSKKVLLADSMGVIVSRAFNGSVSSSFAWLGAIAYTLQIYMDFSGYSDMAIGLGAMFGFRIPENFEAPYRAKTIRDFWRRWHITLSIWFRDYVYIPLGGNKRKQLRTVFNILIVWLLTGIWHGANLTFIIWGIVYGILVLFEKKFSIEEKLRESSILIRLFYRFFTLLAVMLLWVVFRAESCAIAADYIAQMFRFERTGAEETLLYLSEYKWALVSCVVLSPIETKDILKKRTWIWPILVLLFIICMAYLVKGTYSPFLYFDF